MPDRPAHGLGAVDEAMTPRRVFALPVRKPMGSTSRDDGRRDELRQVIAGAPSEIGVDRPLARKWRRRLALG